MERAKPIKTTKRFDIGYGFGTVVLEVYIGTVRLFDVLKDHVLLSNINESWLKTLRHENSNYEYLLSSLLPKTGFVREEIHENIKTEINNMLHQQWQCYFLELVAQPKAFPKQKKIDRKKLRRVQHLRWEDMLQELESEEDRAWLAEQARLDGLEVKKQQQQIEEQQQRWLEKERIRVERQEERRRSATRLKANDGNELLP